MSNLLLGRKLEAHLYMQRIPLSEVPESEEGLTQWMHELYDKKVLENVYIDIYFNYLNLLSLL